MLTPDEQCQCYGYKSAKKSSNDYCTSHLKCKISLWKTSETVISMDGTPCDEKKVCWNKKCKHIQFGFEFTGRYFKKKIFWRASSQSCIASIVPSENKRDGSENKREESKRDVIPSTHLDLELTERSLANENLPVWITSGVVDEDDLLNKDNDDLQRNYEIFKLLVMKHLGKFSTYHQPETSSAAVYFHKRREFDEMIDVRITIQGLSVKSINSDGSIRSWLGHNGFHENKKLYLHTSKDLTIEPRSRFGVNEVYKHLRTYKDQIFDGYPEILVVVDWGIAELWVSEMM
ncbi:hypothetical protein PV327_010937 [Microctonus hyperodae]|uniref:Uncharacterized protein n=1 Tax=Microctonus hyperodae TaxID=165561 RepID=A0AA39F0J2_MICHY|nr:hypothetical protein PV327_010937 [Microctonus hyperodae]